MAASSIHAKQFLFQKSKAYLGKLGPVTRTRVADLWGDDSERPAGPTQRAATSASLFLPIPGSHAPCNLRQLSAAS